MNPTTAPERPHQQAELTGDRRPAGAGEEGLTTLEWLLVVAAVAGLAALAVVVVNNVVADTAEGLSQTNSRQVAYDLATTDGVRPPTNTPLNYDLSK